MPNTKTKKKKVVKKKKGSVRLRLKHPIVKTVLSEGLQVREGAANKPMQSAPVSMKEAAKHVSDASKYANGASKNDNTTSPELIKARKATEDLVKKLVKRRTDKQIMLLKKRLMQKKKKSQGR